MVMPRSLEAGTSVVATDALLLEEFGSGELESATAVAVFVITVPATANGLTWNTSVSTALVPGAIDPLSEHTTGWLPV